MQKKLLGIISVDIDTIGQDHIFWILQILEKKRKYNEAVHQIFTESGGVLLPLLFNFAVEYATRKVQVNQDVLKSNGTYQLLIHAADDKNIKQNHT
jgi:hypothetical protein